MWQEAPAEGLNSDGVPVETKTMQYFVTIGKLVYHLTEDLPYKLKDICS